MKAELRKWLDAVATLKLNWVYHRRNGTTPRKQIRTVTTDSETFSWPLICPMQAETGCGDSLGYTESTRQRYGLTTDDISGIISAADDLGGDVYYESNTPEMYDELRRAMIETLKPTEIFK